MPEAAQRPYNCTDSEAITISDTMRGHFETYQADFLTIDSSFDTTFINDWKNATDQALHMPTDETKVDLQQHAQSLVDKAMEDCRKALGDLRYFADRAFGNSGRYGVFGFERAQRTRNVVANHVVLMMGMWRLATRFATPLGDQGMTPAQIAALRFTAMNLLEAEMDHEEQKRLRILATVERIELGIYMWSFVQRTQRAADVVFADDAVKRALFAL